MNFCSITNLLCSQLDEYVAKNCYEFIKMLPLPEDAIPEILILRERQIQSKSNHPLEVTSLLIDAAKISYYRNPLYPLIIFMGSLAIIFAGISRSASVSQPNNTCGLIETVDRLKWFPEDVIANLWTLHKRRLKQKWPSLKIDFEIMKEISLLILAFHIEIRLDNLWLPSNKKKIDK